MLLVSKPQDGPVWTPVMGAEVLFAPITRPMLRRARRAAVAALGGAQPATDDQAALDEQIADLGDAFSYALLIEAIVDWRDVFTMGDGDDTGEGVPLPCTDEAKAQLLADPLVLEAFDAAWIVPFVTRERERAAPGKESSPSQDGISTKGTEETTIAASPAPLATATDVSNAPMPRTKRKPRTKRSSGGS